LGTGLIMPILLEIALVGALLEHFFLSNPIFNYLTINYEGLSRSAARAALTQATPSILIFFKSQAYTPCKHMHKHLYMDQEI